MKKLFILTAAVIAILGFVGLVSSAYGTASCDDLTGTWTVSSVICNGVAVNFGSKPVTIAFTSATAGILTIAAETCSGALAFTASGTTTMTFYGNSECTPGTSCSSTGYSCDETWTRNATQEFTCSLDGNNLTFSGTVSSSLASEVILGCSTAGQAIVVSATKQ